MTLLEHMYCPISVGIHLHMVTDTLYDFLFDGNAVTGQYQDHE